MKVIQSFCEKCLKFVVLPSDKEKSVWFCFMVIGLLAPRQNISIANLPMWMSNQLNNFEQCTSLAVLSYLKIVVKDGSFEISGVLFTFWILRFFFCWIVGVVYFWQGNLQYTWMNKSNSHKQRFLLSLDHSWK